ncbi:ABC transporter permease [Bacillaceae bacterium S4-13-58]
MKNLVRKGWRPTLVLLILFILWELITSLLDIPEWLVPSPSAILLEGFIGFSEFAPDLLATLYLSILGFLVGSGLGVFTATLLHLVPKIREAFYPLLIATQNIPIIVMAPLLVIWFGFGLLPKVIVITLVCFFPVTISVMDGFRQVPREYSLYFRMSGATRWGTFRKLEWPFALPALFSGLKLSATYSVMGAVISEWLGAKNGIGVYMTLASSSFRTDRVFWAIFVVVLLSLSYVGMVMIAEKKIVSWNSDKER